MGEVRVTFTKNEGELEAFIRTKTSAPGYLKDIARVEMEKEKAYIKSLEVDADKLAKSILDKVNEGINIESISNLILEKLNPNIVINVSGDVKQETNEVKENEEINLEDIDISDLED